MLPDRSRIVRRRIRRAAAVLRTALILYAFKINLAAVVHHKICFVEIEAVIMQIAVPVIKREHYRIAADSRFFYGKFAAPFHRGLLVYFVLRDINVGQFIGFDYPDARLGIEPGDELLFALSCKVPETKLYRLARHYPVIYDLADIAHLVSVNTELIHTSAVCGVPYLVIAVSHYYRY